MLLFAFCKGWLAPAFTSRILWASIESLEGWGCSLLSHCRGSCSACCSPHFWGWYMMLVRHDWWYGLEQWWWWMQVVLSEGNSCCCVSSHFCLPLPIIRSSPVIHFQIGSARREAGSLLKEVLWWWPMSCLEQKHSYLLLFTAANLITCLQSCYAPDNDQWITTKVCRQVSEQWLGSHSHDWKQQS